MSGYERLLPEDPEVSHWVKAVLAKLDSENKLPAGTHIETSQASSCKTEAVNVDAIDHEEGTTLGPYLLLNKAWKSLTLDNVLDKSSFSIDQIQTAKVSIFNRLIEPCSENALTDWAQTTALDDLLGIQTATWAEDRFYRISDRLLSRRRVLEEHLREREADIFRLERTILMYDLTNSYFEGDARNNSLAKRSANSKEKRSDCPLISVGVVLDEYIPVGVVDTITGILLEKSGPDAGRSIVAPRLLKKSDVVLGEKKIVSVIAGVVFDAERNARPSWRLTSGDWPEDPSGVVLGGTYARTQGLGVDSPFGLNGVPFRVSGILENYNSSEDYMVFMPIGKAQSLFGLENEVSVINIQSVALDRDPELLKSVSAALNGGIPNIKAMSPQQFSTMKYILLKKTFRFLLAIVVATLFVSIFSIFNIVTTALYSRVREIGLLKAVGASRAQLLKIFFFEYTAMGLLGGVIGYPVGVGATFLLDRFLLKLGAGTGSDPLFFLAAVGVGVLCCLLASTYPTYQLAGIRITESFRTQWEV